MVHIAYSPPRMARPTSPQRRNASEAPAHMRTFESMFALVQTYSYGQRLQLHGTYDMKKKNYNNITEWYIYMCAMCMCDVHVITCICGAKLRQKISTEHRPTESGSSLPSRWSLRFGFFLLCTRMHMSMSKRWTPCL